MYEWIADQITREYCENHGVDNDTLDLIREGKVLRYAPGALCCTNGNWYREPEIILLYCLETGRYLHHKVS